MFVLTLTALIPLPKRHQNRSPLSPRDNECSPFHNNNDATNKRDNRKYDENTKKYGRALPLETLYNYTYMYIYNMYIFD